MEIDANLLMDNLSLGVIQSLMDLIRPNIAMLFIKRDFAGMDNAATLFILLKGKEESNLAPGIYKTRKLSF